MFAQVWIVFFHDWTLFVGSCVQRAPVSFDQPADALCTIVSITDNLLGCKIVGCNLQQHSHAYIRPTVSWAHPVKDGVHHSPLAAQSVPDLKKVRIYC